MFESKTGVFLIGGVLFFLFAFLSNAAVPIAMDENPRGTPAEELVADNENILWQFKDLSKRYPEQFEAAFGTADETTCAEALRLGRQVYVGEGCWHCHSQFVRPVSNESKRWGPVSETWEYQNELQRPVLFGTRRVGPDLSRQGGRHSNGWHAVHFWDPSIVSPESPMPRYTWFFDGDPSKPNRRGLALMTYIQWLGSWHETYPYYEEIEEVRSSE